MVSIVERVDAFVVHADHFWRLFDPRCAGRGQTLGTS